jgi:hypothetical protein
MSARREDLEMTDEDPRLESRVARIESDVAHINSSVAIMQIDLRELRREMGDGLKAVNTRIDALDTRLNGRIDALAKSASDDNEALDKKVTSHFLWLLSTMIACMLAIVAALLRGPIAR